MKASKEKAPKARTVRRSIGGARLAKMIEEATVDAYGEDEQATGWFTMFEQCLELPFDTRALGVEVTVVALELRDDNRIVAICRRGKEKLAVGVGDLPLPSPRPEGAEWVEAYRAWLGQR